jgi:hypothetical protein
VLRKALSTAVTTRYCNIFPMHKDHLASLPRESFTFDDVSESSRPFAVQIVPSKNLRYMSGRAKLIGFRKVFYRTLVIK